MNSHRERPERRIYVPGLMVVRFREDVLSAEAPRAHPRKAGRRAASRAASLPSGVRDPLQALISKKTLRGAVPIFASPAAGRGLGRRGVRTARGPASIAGIEAAVASSIRESDNEDLRGIAMLRVGSTNLEKLEKTLRGTRGVAYAHRVPARWVAAPKAKGRSTDPLVNRQWGLRAIKWFQASIPDARAVKVAVLDTGIDLEHPELSWVKAIQYRHDGAGAKDILGHGTHVAGIICADANNTVGIAGVCRCDLHVWKIFGDEPEEDGEFYVDSTMFLRALNAARNEGVKVLNLSIGGPARSQTEELLFRRLQDAGCTVVAAMGNEFEEGNPTEYPGAYPGVLAVGAINEASRRAPFSNTGRHIGIYAPGVNILSTVPTYAGPDRDERSYASWSGTSMATPHVAGAATLVLAKNPTWTPAQVTARLKATSGALPSPPRLGAGLVDLEAAL